MPVPDSPAKAAAAAILLEAREACGLRVAIIGAGFGGLTLARALHVAGVGARVFEQDESLNHVWVGGELRVPSAKRTLAALGLEAEWRALRAMAPPERHPEGARRADEASELRELMAAHGLAKHTARVTA